MKKISDFFKENFSENYVHCNPAVIYYVRITFGGVTMPYSERKKSYNADYIKQNIKRIPLDVQKEKYDEIKAAAEAAGESVNGFIKAVDLRMFISPEDAAALTEKYLQGLTYDKAATTKGGAEK